MLLKNIQGLDIQIEEEDIEEDLKHVKNPAMRNFLKENTKKVSSATFFEALKDVFLEVENNNDYEEVKQILMNNVELNVLSSMRKKLAEDSQGKRDIPMRDLAGALKNVHQANRLEQGKSTDNITQVTFTGDVDLNQFKKK